MIILASVAISAVSKSGVFDTTKDVADLYNQTVAEESNYIKKIINNLEGYSTGELGNILVDPVEAIPIYTKEQLLKIGSGEEVQIDGKTYVYSLNSTYRLMNDITLDYNGVWHLPSNVILSGGDHQVKIKDTSKGTEIYYYYNKTSNYKFATTQEGYIYDEMILYYDGVNNTGNGHSTNQTVWKDLSGEGQDGIIENYTSDVWQENSLKFNGSDTSVILPDTFNTLYNSNCTVEITFQLYKSGERDILFGNYEINANGVNLEFNSSKFLDNCIRFFWEGNPDFKATNTLITASDIYTLVLVFDKDNTIIYMYVNGVHTETNTDTGYSRMLDPTIPFRIGRDNRTGSTGLDGEVYSLRLYNKVLTSDEISSNYKIDKVRFVL